MSRPLFEWGSFQLSGGQESPFRINAEVLSILDLCALAELARSNPAVLGPYGGVKPLSLTVEPLCAHLASGSTVGPWLLVDDVWTTGRTMSQARHALWEHGEQSIGLVLFARRPVPDWVRAIFLLALPEP